MSYQRSGEFSAEPSRRTTPDESLKQVKSAVNQAIKRGEGKRLLHATGAEYGAGEGGSSNVFYSGQQMWSSLPLFWRYGLAMDVLGFGLPGLLCLLFPSRALDLHRMLAHVFNWAGPSTGVASNALLMYVQTVGALMCSLAGMCAWGTYTRSYAFGQAWATFRLALAACLFYIAAVQPSTSLLGTFTRPFNKYLGLADPYTTGSTTYKFLFLPALHSLFMAGLVGSSPDLLKSLYSRAPTHLA